MNVADYMLARLADAGITHGFGLYGGAVAELFDAFTRQTKMKYIVCQHEQACAFAAEGYAKASGKPGFAFATSGPGGLNLVTGIANCYFDSVPCIFITGNVSTAFANPRGSKLRQLGFQECDITSIVKPITKYAVKPDGPLHAAYCLETAVRYATEGRPGPVLLDLPIDLQRAEMLVEMTGEPFEPRPYPPCADAATAFLADLAQAQRPGILVGGGAHRSRAAVLAFATAHNIPVFRTWNAQDVVTDDHPCYGGTVGTYGGPGRNFGVQNCDLLLVLGCRLSGRITGGMPETFARGAKLYWVDVDADLMREQPGRRPDVQVHADAGEFVRAIVPFYGLGAQDIATDIDNSIMRDLVSPKLIWPDQCREWVRKYDPVTLDMLTGDFHHYGAMRILSERLPANATMVYDTGGNAIMQGHCFRSKAGQRIFSSNGSSPMGFSMCGALGAWIADPSRVVVCIIGDGGMSMNIQELETIKRLEANVKIFIFNNGVLGNTLSFQRVNNKPEIACSPPDYSAPNFSAIASAYGIKNYSLGEWSRLNYVIENTLAHDGPVIVDVIHRNFCEYALRLSRWDCGIDEMHPQLPEEEFLSNMLIEPLTGWEGRRK